MNKPSDPYFSTTVEKSLIILGLFDREHTRRSLAEISHLTGFNKTTCYRFVNTFVQLGYLKKNINNKSLKLGPKALLFGHKFIHGFDLLQVVKPLIDKNFIEYQITIDSALLDELTLLSLYRREAPNIIHFRLPLVMRDLYARAMGKAVLSQLEDAALERYLDQMVLTQRTPKTLTTRKELLADLELTRGRGYSFNNEEYVTGLICMGAPLTNYQTNMVMGAISFDFPAAEHSIESIEREYAGILSKLAGEMSEMITIAET